MQNYPKLISKTVSSVIILPSGKEEDITVPVTHEVFKEEPKFFVPFEEEEKLEPKVIPSMPKPVIPTDTTDYKAKYEESLTTIRKLEDENIRLINELVEAKAKIATIKDIID